jgi:hypothetical protein
MNPASSIAAGFRHAHIMLPGQISCSMELLHKIFPDSITFQLILQQARYKPEPAESPFGVVGGRTHVTVLHDDLASF